MGMFTEHVDEVREEYQQEIDRLRRWKAEATEVIVSWENVWVALGRPGDLGAPKAESSIAEIEALRSATKLIGGEVIDADHGQAWCPAQPCDYVRLTPEQARAVRRALEANDGT